MECFRTLRHGTKDADKKPDGSKPRTGRHGKESVAESEPREGRGWRKKGRGGAALAALAFAAGCYASGPAWDHHAPWDEEAGSQHQDEGGCEDEVDEDKEALLAQGRNARLTGAGHLMWLSALDSDTATLRITDRVWNQIGDLVVLSHDEPSVWLHLDDEEFTITFCGTVLDGKALFRTDRERGFVHCKKVGSGSDSNPLHHDVDGFSTETIITNTKTYGEYATDGDHEDCSGISRIIKRQWLAFQAPLQQQDNFGPDGGSLLLHALSESGLKAFETDLLSVGCCEASVRAGNPLASGDLAGGASLEAGGLEVHMEWGDGGMPVFSYAWLPDQGALVWEAPGSCPNEKEVNVDSESGYHAFLLRHAGAKSDGAVYLKVFRRQDVQVLTDGGQAMFGGQIYSVEIKEGACGGIQEITLRSIE